MDVHIRLSRWVVRWFWSSVGLGAIAIANMIGRDLTRRQDRNILMLGIVNWVLGGLICFALDAVRIQSAAREDGHEASDFHFAGKRRVFCRPDTELRDNRKVRSPSLRVAAGGRL